MVDFFRLFGVQKNENAGQADELAHINQEMYKKSVELNERNKTLSLLQKIDEIILSDLTHLNEIAEKVTSLLVTDIDFQLVSLFLHDKQASKLKRIALSQSPGAGGGDAQQEGPAYLLEIPFWATDNLIIQAVNEKVMKFSSGITEVLLSSRSGVSAPEGIQSVFAYPLSVRGEVIGAMVVCMRETQDELSEYRRDLLNRLGELIGIALDNSLLYNEVQASNEKLKTLDKLKDEFVSLASHELRTPLTSIKGSLQLIMGNPQDLLPFQQELLGICLRNADRLIRLVNDVLDLSKIEAGKLTLKLSDQIVSHLIELALASVSTLAKERQTTIDVSLSSDLPPVQADQDRIVQVLTNLLSNAIKFSGSAERICVVAELRRVAWDDEGVVRGRRGVDRAIEISVTDRGRGIAQEDLDKLFVPFHQLDSSVTRETPGTGLGLAICKGIVEEHGGRIWARSEGLGLGTTVTFLLPVEGPPRRRLFVADDDSLFVSLLVEIFGSAGYLVTSASDGEAALQMIEQAVPDLLILDLLLPRVNGWEVLKILRAKATTRDLPILAVTSLGASDAEQTLALGANDYLSKPISPSVLTDTVSRLIAGAERRRRDAEAEKVAERLLVARPAVDQGVERVRLRILVVEDNPINMELLERGGYELYTCGDGREVMRQAKTHRPDLILLDINLPHIDGLTLARMLREDPETRAVTILAVSAYSVAGDKERIRQAGCDGFIPKPIDTKTFLQTIATLLERGKAQ